jgi:hypothetical protein
MEQELFSPRAGSTFRPIKQSFNASLTIPSSAFGRVVPACRASQDLAGLIPSYPFRGVKNLSGRRGAIMHLTSNLDWTAKLNIAAVCASSSFIVAIVVGLF